ncbi:MAG: DNA repair protein RecO [Proteobacteria bacterium]|nr:DNA repair protein RecO [Pseudomonadota bacterium]
MVSRARLYRATSILIRQRNLREADRIVTLLTRERGKLSAVAKGVRRPRSKLAGGLQLFSHARVQLAAGRSLEIVTQVEPQDAFYHLREDVPRYNHACYACEMVDALLEEQQADSRIFDLLLATLDGLDRGGDPSTLVHGFELKLLTGLGYGPELDTCVSCGASIGAARVGFSAAQGGVVCGRCLRAQGAAALPPAALEAMRELLRLPPQELAKRRLSKPVRQRLDSLLRAFVDYRLERPLKSAPFLSQEGTGQGAK